MTAIGWAVAGLALLALGARDEAAARGVGLDELAARVPALTRDATGRWPMVAWTRFLAQATNDVFQAGEPLTPEQYRELARRGLIQTIRLHERYIPMAQAIQKAGFKVIVLEGEGGAGPGALAPGARHTLDPGFKPGQPPPHPCPLLLEGWHLQAMKDRAVLRRFKEAGVVLDGFWMDAETQPWGGVEEWEQSRHCDRCRGLFPPGVLESADAYRAFIGRFKQDLYSAYMAAPVREAFPACLVLNWGLVYSTPEAPTPGYWGNVLYSPRSAGLFTGLNPVAYGHGSMFRDYWKQAWPDPDGTPCDEAHMDRLYTHVMLGQMSRNAENAARWAPEKPCVPWVCRRCPDPEDPQVPPLSRPRYREILRHLWLRGADSMQIYNPIRKDAVDSCLDELADAVLVYDEALAFREFLDQGAILNTAIPAASEEGAVWSGLKRGNQAMIRAFTPGASNVVFSVRPWPEAPAIQLEAPREGAYYRISMDGTVERGLPGGGQPR